MNNKILNLILCLVISGIISADIYAQQAVISIRETILPYKGELKLANVAEIETFDNEFCEKLNSLGLSEITVNEMKPFVTKYEIIRILRKNKINMSDIVFKGAKLSSIQNISDNQDDVKYEVFQKAKDYILDFYKLDEKDTLIELKKNNIQIPSGNNEYEFSVINDNKFNGTVLLECNILQNFRIIKSCKFTFVLKIFKNILTANHMIQKGVTVQKEDLCHERKDVSRMNEMELLDEHDLIGKKALRTIKHGEILTSRLFVREFVIKKGKKITIESESGSISISVQGKALENGYAGDEIKAMNVDSKAVIRGVIKDSNTIIVRQ